MSWELLKTDYVDAVFEGLRKYQQITNPDSTLSFADVTNYTVKEGSFIGAKDINAITTAINAIMTALEQGTDLYEVFTQFFETQKVQFQETADENLQSFQDYTSNLENEADKTIEQIKMDYSEEIKEFEQLQEAVYAQWFSLIKGQLSKDAAGNLQLQLEEIAEREFRHYTGLVNQTTEFLQDGSIVQDSSEATTTTVFGYDENGNRLITQTVVVKNILTSYTKTTLIIPETETSNKKIIENYTASGLAAYVMNLYAQSDSDNNAVAINSIGDGLLLSEDGTLSVDTDAVADKVAESMTDFNETEVEEIYEAAETAAGTNDDEA